VYVRWFAVCSALYTPRITENIALCVEVKNVVTHVSDGEGGEYNLCVKGDRKLESCVSGGRKFESCV